MVNYQKSAITFRDQVLEEEKNAIKDILKIYNEGGTSKYLGLPECFSGSKVELLSYLKERTQGRLDGWYFRKLSQAGKEVLLKSKAASLPVFAMSCFRLPKSLIAKLSSIMAKFCWSSDEGLKKIHWISWERLCLPKSASETGLETCEPTRESAR